METVERIKIYEDNKYMKNISRIFLFGDSWVEGQGTYEELPDGSITEPTFHNDHGLEKLSRWRKENSWNKFISEKTNCTVENFAKQGSNNYFQFEKLNEITSQLTETDLVIFGFTSKLRDRVGINYAYDSIPVDNPHNPLLSRDNPIIKFLAWEKISLKNIKNNFTLPKQNETEFTEKFLKDYITLLHSELTYEHIAQTNYYLYQERFKSLGLNIIFFDLFEQYINPVYVDKNLHIDNNIYINYSKKTMNDFLIEHEINNVKNNQTSVWEHGFRRPDLNNVIYHPNHHGYKIYVDYLFDKVIPQQYKFKNF